VQSGSTPKNSPFDQGGSIPFLKVYNIVNNKIDFHYRPQFITKETHSTKLQRSIALPGDVLMNIVGPPLGKIALLTDQFPEWNLNQAITLFRVNPNKLNNKFLYYVLCEGGIVREVLHDTKGSVGQVNISLSQCRESILPLPSVNEQTEIVRRVEQLLTYADQVEQQVKNAQARVNQLTQSILAKAFRGELTEQWRQDNPELISGDNSAAALLERIKAERAAATTSKKKASARKAKA
jgi:type I restriction enzyme S subunit